MNEIKPWRVLEQVADAVPEETRENIVVIGSMAAAYAYFGDQDRMAVRTKDIDCLLKPQGEASAKGETITRKLLDAGWRRLLKGKYQTPGTAETPDVSLPGVRLYPPGIDPESENAWFIELHTEPESPKDTGKRWHRMIISEGHFGIPSFRYLSITAFKPEKIAVIGIYCARPQMMVLGNLLEHPKIKSESMEAPIAGRKIKRINKDLGRVLAIGYLAEEHGLMGFRPWSDDWKEALQSCFPDEWSNLAVITGSGLRELLASVSDMDEAHHSCVYGLLSSFPVTLEELTETGERILGEAIEPLEKLKTR